MYQRLVVIVVQKVAIKDIAGRVWGWIQIEDDGNKKAIDRSGRIVGYYKTFNNATYDNKGKVVAYGDVVGSLIKMGN